MYNVCTCSTWILSQVFALFLSVLFKDDSCFRGSIKKQRSTHALHFCPGILFSYCLKPVCLHSCSASSYLLGLSSLPYQPFLMGTLSAMAVWGPLYATIGGASRAVLQNGGNLGEVLSGSPAILNKTSQTFCTREHQPAGLGRQ